MAFIKAVKEQAKLRLAIFGPSGAGKTFTALRLAAGLGGAIGCIDSERGRAKLYADRFDFAVLELNTKPEKSVEGYCRAIADAGKDFNVLIVDSLSHAWQELLEQVDQLAAGKFHGNSWSAWSEATPRHKKLVDALLGCPCHLIVTMRSKTEWTQEKTDNGKLRPVKIGLAPEQGKGIEYEFDLLMEMNQDHYATISKDRTGKFQDQIIQKPGEDMGRALAAWLGEGAVPDEPAEIPLPPEIAERMGRLKPLLQTVRMGPGWEDEIMRRAGVFAWDQMTPEQLDKVIAIVAAKQNGRSNGVGKGTARA